MKNIFFIILSLFTLQSLAAVTVGEKAHNFKLQGHDGKYYELNKLKGKTVVLEWFNHGCPFVKKHYKSGNMQALQKEFKSKVVWLSVSSSAPGKQGYLSSPEIATKQYQESKMHSTAILLDGEKGALGKSYGAVTTPHMIIINPKGNIAYNGAIDSIASSDSSDIATATPLTKNAIQAIMASRKVASAKNKPYGCGVKY